MMRPARLTAFLTCLLAYSAPCEAARHSRAKDAIPLARIQALTFRKDALTTHRRIEPMPQLKCVGGSAAGLFEPDVVRCVSSGSSFSPEDIEWTCTASLPPEFKLGSTDVVCEGFSDADDDHVLKGSCGLEYRLVLTDAGEAKYGHWGNKPVRRSRGKPAKWTDELASILFWVVFLGILLVIIAGFCSSSNAGRHRPRPRWNAGSNGDDDDPPPPYDPRPPRYSARKEQTSSRRADSSWRPGFFSGAAAGAAGGYYAGRRANGGEGSSRSAASNNRGSESSSSSFSSTRYESTGFGGTRRR